MVMVSWMPLPTKFLINSDYREILTISNELIINLLNFVSLAWRNFSSRPMKAEFG